MTDPVDQEPPEAHTPTVAEPSIVAWDDVPPTGDGSGSGRQNQVMDVAVSVAALAALVVLSLARAGASGTTGSERIGYVIGGVLIALVISAAARWLWIRARRRNDPSVRFLSPWIPIGAVIVAVLSLFGGNRA